MTRESAEVKGRRLLGEGRLTVQYVDLDNDGKARQAGLIIATCRGDSGETYRLGYDPIRKEWRCTCEARSRCSHLVALMLVTVKE